MPTLQELKSLDYTKTEQTEGVWILQTATVLNHIDTLQVIQKVVL